MQRSFAGKKQIIFLFSLVICLINSCEDDSNRIPYSYVDFTISINNPNFSELRAITNSIVVHEEDAGVIGQNNTDFGVIIYRSSMDEFMAYDRICPHKPSEGCAVKVRKGEIRAVCPCCQSEFELETGYPAKGVSKYPLKEYKTSFDGEQIHVYNY